ncbi:MAG: dienelactone hydrolase family protein [Verrucomicrobiota bacterium]
MKAPVNVMPDRFHPVSSLVSIPVSGVKLEGELEIPAEAPGIVLFAHGSGSSRHSPRNQFVARILRDAGIGTLLLDLLTEDEEHEDSFTGGFRFDIPRLATRVLGATRWLLDDVATRDMPVGYFGASTGAAAALVAAATLGGQIAAVVSRGGRPDLAGDSLSQVQCPTLLLVGGLDDAVMNYNVHALGKLRCIKELKIIPNATHLFAEPGKLEQVAWISAAWFRSHLLPPCNP